MVEAEAGGTSRAALVEEVILSHDASCPGPKKMSSIVVRTAVSGPFSGSPPQMAVAPLELKAQARAMGKRVMPPPRPWKSCPRKVDKRVTPRPPPLMPDRPALKSGPVAGKSAGTGRSESGNPVLANHRVVAVRVKPWPPLHSLKLIQALGARLVIEVPSPGPLGREQGQPLVGLRPAKMHVEIEASIAIEVLRPALLKREQGRPLVGLRPARVPQMVSGSSHGSWAATPCLPTTTVTSVETKVPLAVTLLGAILRTLDASPGQGPAQTLRGVGPALTLPLTTRRESQQHRDSREGAGDTAPSGERPADRLPPSTASTEPNWLTVKFDEVTDEERKALADFVRRELEALEGNFEWEKFEDVVQSRKSCCGHDMTRGQRDSVLAVAEEATERGTTEYSAEFSSSEQSNPK